MKRFLTDVEPSVKIASTSKGKKKTKSQPNLKYDEKYLQQGFVVHPTTKNTLQTVLGAKAANEIEKYLYQIIQLRVKIDDMSSNIEETLILQLKECTNFALQIDESTDVTNMAQLLVFIRSDYHGEVNKEFIFFKPLLSNTTSENILT